MTIGIYKITNTKNNKLYIGSSKNIKRRWENHRSMLKNNRHTSIHLQRAYNKYGKESFKFEILEECLINKIVERENYYLNLLLKSNLYIERNSKFFINNGYNILPSANKGFNSTHKRDSILKQLKSRNLGKTLKVDINGKILNTYDIISEIKDHSRGSIYLSKSKKQCLKNKNYGYISEKDYYEGYKPKELKTWNKGTKGIMDGNPKKVFVYDAYGRFYKEFTSLKEAGSHFKTTNASISVSLDIWERTKTGRPTIKTKYRFFSTKQPKNITEKYNIIKLEKQPSIKNNIKVFTYFDEFVGYTNSEEIGNLLGFSKYYINSYLSRNRKFCNNYKLQYHEDIV